MSAVVFLGMMVGAYAWGYVSDKYGRRTGFLATAAATFLFGLASAFAPSFAWLVLFRCFVGFGLGGVPVAFTLFLEFVPSANRGKWLVTMESFWTVGSFFESALAWALLPTHGWRSLLAFSTLPLFMLLVCFPWPPSLFFCHQKARKQKWPIWPILHPRLHGRPHAVLIGSERS